MSEGWRRIVIYGAALSVLGTAWVYVPASPCASWRSDVDTLVSDWKDFRQADRGADVVEGTNATEDQLARATRLGIRRPTWCPSRGATDGLQGAGDSLLRRIRDDGTAIPD